MKTTRHMLLWILVILLTAGCQPAVPTAQDLPDGERWLTHFNENLLPFWDTPDALGDPIGNFPSERCDDGSAFNPARPCPEIAFNGWLMMEQEYVVSRSRQTYGYGVAFHLTGDPRYLAFAQSGVEYLRENAFDRVNGGTYAYWNGDSGQWEPDYRYRNPQELAYSLLGVSFYYYLTRDTAVLPDILAVKDYIFDTYYNPDLNALQWMLAEGGDANYLDKRIVAQLDNLNAYLVLLTPLLPEPEQSEWKADLQKLTHILIDEFYSAEENLFFLTVNEPRQRDLDYFGTDFGHTIKSMWMIYFVGLITEDAELVAFAQENGAQVLERAYIEESGAWANGVNPGNRRDDNKDWWIYNELDQFAMTMTLSDPAFARYLEKTTQYYFTYFVDPAHGEIWSQLDARTNKPAEGSLPKSWPWKSAYHSFEHALVGYITAQQYYGQPVTLYYAFAEQPAEQDIQPYFFRGDIEGITVESIDGDTVYRVVFRNIR